MVYAIIAAGGIGSRFGADKPKQLIKIGNESILRKTVGVFAGIDLITAIAVACPTEWIPQCQEELKDFENVYVVSGGATRNESVISAAEFIQFNFKTDKNTIVVTHDAVRPFVDEMTIIDTIRETQIYGAAVAAVEAVDTIVECEGHFISRIPDRKKVYQVQTPQTFLLESLLDHYYRLSEEQRASLTDCSGIYFAVRDRVSIVKGDRANIKITYREDIQSP